jgi:hypothetical protein
MKFHVLLFSTIGIPFTIILAVVVKGFISLSNKFTDEPIKPRHREGFQGVAYWLGVSYYIGLISFLALVAVVVWSLL